MEEVVYRQIPCMVGESQCPICQKTVVATKETGVMLYKSCGAVTRVCRIMLPYCTHCKIPLGNREVMRQIKRDYSNFYAVMFPVGKKPSLDAVQKKMRRCGPHRPDSVGGCNHSYEVVRRADCIWKTPKRLQTVDRELCVCPTCANELCSGFALIPLDDIYAVKIQGLECRNCSRLFLTESAAVKNLLIDNEYAKEFTLNGRTLWNYSATNEQRNREKKINDVLSAVVLIAVAWEKNNVNMRKDYLIVNSANEQSEEKGILHYTNPLARELLSAAYRYDRFGKGKWNGVKFKIEQKLSRDNADAQMPENIMPTVVQIRAGGGYYQKLKNRFEEIVDLLLYSPTTGRYEIAKATYNILYGYAYMDYSRFRAFVREFGNPRIGLEFKMNKATADLDRFRTESILRECGYSVSETDRIPAKLRQGLLADLVDLDIVEVSQVVSFLDFFIKMHPLPKDVCARQKWEEDRSFISDYKLNPKRFLIGDPIQADKTTLN